MNVRCIECQHFSLRFQAAMARQGYGRCALDVDHPGRFQSATFQRQCEHFVEAPAADAAKRIAWLAAQSPGVTPTGKSNMKGGQR